jgi:hypothetical protein
MEVLCGLARRSNGYHNWRPGRTIRWKWRILDGKEGEWPDPKFRAPRWYPHLSWLRTNHLALMSKFELCTGTYRIYWGPANWVALCVAKTKAILPYLMGVHWDSAWATRGVFTEVYAWKTCTRVRWALIISLTTSWTVTSCGALQVCVYRVVMFIPLQGWLLIRISMLTLGYG